MTLIIFILYFLDYNDIKIFFCRLFFMTFLEERKMTSLRNFTNIFSKSLTLKNEIIPVGKTLDFIKENKLLEDDELRSEKYKQAKEIIHSYDKYFIENVLKNCNYNWEPLAKALSNNCDVELIEKQAEKARAEIGEKFYSFKQIIKEEKKDTILNFESLFKEELFSYLLPQFITDPKQLEIISHFNRFTSYFTGFNENRRNFYSIDPHSSAISFRIVNDNFPKFLSNINTFRTWQKLCPEIIKNAQTELKNNQIILPEQKLDDIFEVNYFNKVICQKDIEKYNQILGGLPATEGTKKLPGLNEYINLAGQQDKDLQDKLRKTHCLKMAMLFKQILSDKENSFKVDAFANDNEVITTVKEFYKEKLAKNGPERILIDLLKNLNKYDDSTIYVQGKNINTLSKELFGGANWNYLRELISQDNEQDKDFKKKLKKADNDVDKAIAKQEFSLKYLGTLINEEIQEKIIKVVSNKEKELVESNENEWPQKLKNEHEKKVIKESLDSIKNIYNFAQLFESKNFNKDLTFYIDFEKALKETSEIQPLYNKVRNFVTKKPYSLEKFKLNFGCPQLAGGWTESKESDYLSVLFIKDTKYYLGIFNENQKPKFDAGKKNKEEKCYKKVRYVQFKDISKMAPKCTTALKEVKKHFNESNEDYVLTDPKKFVKELRISKEIFKLNVTDEKPKKFQKAYKSIDEKVYRESLNKWITFVKDFLVSYKTTSEFNYSTLKNAAEYDELTEFYADVDNISYKIDFDFINDSYIDSLVNEGKLYLFQIYNKDFSEGSTGTKNLHTMYLESIFDPRNAKNGIVKLNGGAELFYRKKSIANEDVIVHKAGSTLVNKLYKNDLSGSFEQIPDSIYVEINKYENGFIKTLSEDASRYYDKISKKEASHEIIKDKRFTQDKFFFHCPITINYKEPSLPTRFNLKVLEFLKNNKDVNIIGIDRGERNLIYITVIDQNGNILESKSFNNIKMNNKDCSIDYHSKLVLKEKERKESKRSWDSVSKIATLKEGYLSSVIQEITKLMIKYNAIISLENLNAGFKRVRGGIAERSVYQKFEKMLIDKLNYLVFKNEDWENAGGLLHAYQLTNKFTTFKEIGQQTGLIFYVPAAYTSKIDPTTGFANVLNLSQIKNIQNMKDFLCSFNSIGFDNKTNLFKFTVDFTKTTVKCLVDIEKKVWNIYTFGKRLVTDFDSKQHFKQKEIDLSNQMTDLLTTYKISYKDGCNILDKIVEDETIDNKFWKCLYYIFKDTLQMRNSKIGEAEDYLISPVLNSKGIFYNSNEVDNHLPQDADANGAYHIALKGLLILRKNNVALSEDEIKKVKTISNKDWFSFVQKERFES